MSRWRSPLLLTSASLAVLALAPMATAQIVDYRVWGTGNYSPEAVPQPGCNASGPFSGPSEGLGMGQVQFAGFACFPTELNPDPNASSFIWTATDTQTAEDGDQIFLEGRGTWTPTVVGMDGDVPILTAVWDGEWTIVDGTGRFAGAKAIEIKMIAENLPFKFTDPVWQFTYEKVGQIQLVPEPQALALAVVSCAPLLRRRSAHRN